MCVRTIYEYIYEVPKVIIFFASITSLQKFIFNFLKVLCEGYSKGESRKNYFREKMLNLSCGTNVMKSISNTANRYRY